MVLSVSRRTDIPAFYGDWFITRLKEGFVYVRNPMNVHQISKIALSPDKIECIVFWTKNPDNEFINKLNVIDKLGYTYYFQYSITSYNKNIEQNIPKKQFQIEKFKKLSNMLGKNKVIWRYDPIFFNDYYTFEYHEKYFDYIASKLSNYTKRCIISFLDAYPKIKKRLQQNNIPEVTESQMYEISLIFSKIAKQYDIKIESCCETADLSQFGIERGHCIDPNLINDICKKNYVFKKDKTQRQNCGCIESIDIGSYNTCRNNCVYCYANWKNSVTMPDDFDSPILCSTINSDDKVTERIIKNCELMNYLPF